MEYKAVLVVCICSLYLCEAEVDWNIKNPLTAYGEDLELVCTGDDCCDPVKLMRWHGGPKGKLLMLRDGEPTNKTKYSTELFSDRFILKIKHVTEADLNINYECSYGFHTRIKTLNDRDVFKSNLNAAANITRQEIIDGEKTNATSVIVWTVVGFILVFVILVGIIIRKKTNQSNVERSNITGDQYESQHLDPNGNANMTTETGTSADEETTVKRPVSVLSSSSTTAEETKVRSPAISLSTTDIKTVSPHATNGSITTERQQGDRDISINRNIDRGFQYSLEDENQINNTHVKDIKHISYKKKDLRYKSFTQPFNINTTDMALAGFFYSGFGQHAQCFCCGFGKDFDIGDDPFDKNCHQPNCHHNEEYREGTNYSNSDDTRLKCV